MKFGRRKEIQQLGVQKSGKIQQGNYLLEILIMRTKTKETILISAEDVEVSIMKFRLRGWQ